MARYLDLDSDSDSNLLLDTLLQHFHFSNSQYFVIKYVLLVKIISQVCQHCKQDRARADKFKALIESTIPRPFVVERWSGCLLLAT